jgi:hypothetical protein
MYYAAERAGETLDPLEIAAEKAWLGIGSKKAGLNEAPPF